MQKPLPPPSTPTLFAMLGRSLFVALLLSLPPPSHSLFFLPSPTTLSLSLPFFSHFPIQTCNSGFQLFCPGSWGIESTVDPDAPTHTHTCRTPFTRNYIVINPTEKKYIGRDPVLLSSNPLVSHESPPTHIPVAHTHTLVQCRFFNPPTSTPFELLTDGSCFLRNVCVCVFFIISLWSNSFGRACFFS